MKETKEKLWGGAKKVRSQSCYQSDKIRDFYSRHYRKGFKIDKIVNGERTKSEQM